MQINDMQQQFLQSISQQARRNISDEESQAAVEAIETLDDYQQTVLALASRWSQIAVLTEEPRLFYAAAAAMFESGLLHAFLGDIDDDEEITPDMVMDHAEEMWGAVSQIASSAAEEMLADILDEQ